MDIVNRQHRRENSRPFPPQEDLKSRGADLLRTRALLKMSHDERNEALADVHCLVRRKNSESLITEDEYLDEMNGAMSKLETKTAYERAKSPSAYCDNKAFKLGFLRAERFQPGPAARRLTLFFETKLEVFGVDKLAKKIDINDLDSQDKECLLESGYVNRLQEKDRAGRNIIRVWWPSQESTTNDFTLQNKVSTV